jgi:hypothetical protein
LLFWIFCTSELIVSVQNLLELLDALDRCPQNLHFWQPLRRAPEIKFAGQSRVYELLYLTAHLFNPS